jgi:hypothetical protein
MEAVGVDAAQHKHRLARLDHVGRLLHGAKRRGTRTAVARVVAVGADEVGRARLVDHPIGADADLRPSRVGR